MKKIFILFVITTLFNSCAGTPRQPAGFEDVTALNINSKFECSYDDIIVLGAWIITDAPEVKRDKFWPSDKVNAYSPNQFWSVKLVKNKKIINDICVFSGESLKTAWLDGGNTLIFELDSKGKLLKKTDLIKNGRKKIKIIYKFFKQGNNIEFGCGDYDEKSETISLWAD